MFTLDNGRILTKDNRFVIEYKKPLEKWLDGTWTSYYCEHNAMVEVCSGSLTKCIKMTKKYKKQLDNRGN